MLNFPKYFAVVSAQADPSERLMLWSKCLFSLSPQWRSAPIRSVRTARLGQIWSDELHEATGRLAGGSNGRVEEKEDVQWYSAVTPRDFKQTVIISPERLRACFRKWGVFSESPLKLLFINKNIKNASVVSLYARNAHLTWPSISSVENNPLEDLKKMKLKSL